ncbi:MAG: sulfotransferase [Phycisphaerales bacterium]|nr:sulfotransferase [Phycisphaerales bacterium]
MNQINPKSSTQATQDAFRHAQSLEDQGLFDQALQIHQQIAKAKPRWAFGFYGLGSAYFGIGKFDDARRNLRKALSIDNKHPAFHAKLAQTYNRLDDQSNAIQSIETARALDPKNAQYLVEHAVILRAQGHPRDAHKLLQTALNNGQESELLSRYYASLCGVLSDPQTGIDHLEPLTKSVNPDPLVTAAHMFVLAHLYNQSAQYDLAYKAATRGSELRKDTYNPQEREQLLNERIGAWSKDRLQSMPRSRVNSDKPVFIVGMPRSGTTLIEQIIASHPKAYGCGELINIFTAAAELTTATKYTPTLVDVLEAIKTPTLDRTARKVLKEMEKQAPKGEKPIRITDKMPLNFQHIGLIETLFPNARIIHCKRHVLDNFISCYLLDFAGLNNHAYAYSPEHFAHFYSVYLKYMDYWKSVSSLPILDITYEETIADQRTATERILEFLDLEWDDQCMSFFDTDRAVNTASQEQVRKPIYTSSQARWKKFESHLKPVMDSLDTYNINWQ